MGPNGHKENKGVEEIIHKEGHSQRVTESQKCSFEALTEASVLR